MTRRSTSTSCGTSCAAATRRAGRVRTRTRPRGSGPPEGWSRPPSDAAVRAGVQAASLADLVPAEPHADALYDAFVGWCSRRGLELYPAQQEALIELFTGA